MTLSNSLPRIMVVDDEPNNIELLNALLKDRYSVSFATRGQMALDLAAKHLPVLILLDVMMPEMDGFEVCRRLKEQPETQDIPVIFVTAKTAREDVNQGLQLGAYYYLAKPIDPPLLLTVVTAVLAEQARLQALRDEIRQTDSIFGLMEIGRFRFCSLEEANILAVLLSKACPDPGSQVVGLLELMVNAIEHGNLGITYADKSRLLQSHGWEKEVARRMALPEYRERRATIQFERDKTSIRFLIRDQGEGFDWHSFMSLDPSRAFDSHGRGIAMANMFSFQRIEYRGCGNEVLAEISLSAESTSVG